MKYILAIFVSLFTTHSFAQSSILWNVTGKVQEQIIFKNNFYSANAVEDMPFLSHSFSEESLSSVEESSGQKKETQLTKYEISSVQDKKLRVTTLNAVNIYLGSAVMNKSAMSVKGQEKKVMFVHTCNNEESIVFIDSLELIVKCKEIRK